MTVLSFSTRTLQHAATIQLKSFESSTIKKIKPVGSIEKMIVVVTQPYRIQVIDLDSPEEILTVNTKNSTKFITDVLPIGRYWALKSDVPISMVPFQIIDPKSGNNLPENVFAVDLSGETLLVESNNNLLVVNTSKKVLFDLKVSPKDFLSNLTSLELCDHNLFATNETSLLCFSCESELQQIWKIDRTESTVPPKIDKILHNFNVLIVHHEATIEVISSKCGVKLFEIVCDHPIETIFVSNSHLMVVVNHASPCLIMYSLEADLPQKTNRFLRPSQRQRLNK